jgi:methylmalonyl-CoA mutase
MSESDTATQALAADARTRWREAVEKALKGAGADGLASRAAGEIEIAPIYFAGDAASVGPLARTAAAIDICGACAARDPGSANTLVLDELMGGATSVLLSVGADGARLAPEQGALEEALGEVDLRLAPVWLDPGESFELGAAALTAIWREQGIGPSEARGGFGADPLGVLARQGRLARPLEQSLDAMAALVGRTREHCPEARAITVDASLYHDAGAREAVELACMAATFIAYLRTLEKAGVAPAEAFAATIFTLAADADLLMTIAKLRAARLVLAKIAGETGGGEAPQLIRAVTSRRMMARIDPTTNLLRLTIAAAGALMGGADSIVVRPHDHASAARSDRFARRIARNIPIVLLEESHLGRVIDPAAGSFALDRLTSDLAEAAWDRLRRIEADGGMSASLESGAIHDALRESAMSRARDVATGKIELIGVSTFARPDDAGSDGDAEEDAPPVWGPGEPLPVARDAAPFERLRRRAALLGSRNGSPPSVLLATLGRPADFAARAAYARGFFASGGIAAIDAGPIETATGAASALAEHPSALVCLASSDEVYEGLAGPAASALVRAGANGVLLVGRPGAARERWDAAGVGGYIHKGCDQIAMLTDALERIESRSGT